MAPHEEPSLLPNAVDQTAAEEPESLYGKYPANPTDYSAGFESVTFAQLANAANRVVWWLENEVGRGNEDQTPAIAYIGPNDFRYVFAFIGAIKAGYKLFLTSPRNSLVAHVALLESLSCTKIIVAGPITPTVDEILNARPMRLLEIASMEHLINPLIPAIPLPEGSRQSQKRRRICLPYLWNHWYSKALQIHPRVDPQLPTAFPENVHSLEADLTHATFNLTPEIFKVLSSSVTLIAHNAWSVDFSLPLSSFTHHLVGVENLCKFSAQSALRPAILFLSSISAVMDLALRPDQVVPEKVLEDLSVPAATGYTESKYLAERMLAYANEKLRIPIAVARVGQVCGATHSPGCWNPNEWIPRLIRGSGILGALPDSLGDYDCNVKDVDWVPVDVLADVVVGLLLKGWAGFNQEQPTDVLVYYLVNLQRTSWGDILPVILSTLSDLKSKHDRGTSVDVVSRQEWLMRLSKSADDLDALQAGNDLAGSNPALRLLDFYEEKFAEKVFPHWETENAASVVTTLQGMDGVSHRDMEKWVQLWWEDGIGY
ncbi:male sterility protein-domain-containing protein [Ustulina deusta]|nr:male sterility protein-domain-containing protein [Ustulina deusta]